MSLPDCAAAVLVLAITFYVLLDGFDLGVGALILFSRDEGDRNAMVESIAPVWDGNETWLILAGVTLLAAFPLAYASLLPALYDPILVMLVALGFRGVAVEFRFQTTRYRRWWDAAFGVGSIVAILSQGLILGTALRGLPAEPTVPSFSLSGFSLLTAAAVLSAYAVLGAGWLLWHTDEALRSLAQRLFTTALGSFALLVTPALCILIGDGGPASRAWQARAVFQVLLGLAALGAWWSAWRARGRPNRPDALVAGMAMVASFLLGIVLLCWPHVVPFSMTVDQAASTTASQVFLLVGVALFLPIVLANGVYVYWTFRRQPSPAGAE